MHQERITITDAQREFLERVAESRGITPDQAAQELVERSLRLADHSQTARDSLIEELLDYTLLVLQSAKTEEARRVTLAVMNHIKSKRSPAQLQRMETDNMRRALS